MKAKRVMYIPGVGIDIEKIRNLSINSIEKRKSIGVDEEKFLLLSGGELNNNKNHKIIIKSLKDLEEKITYVIAGKGKNKEKLEKLARENNVDLVLLGYRSDVLELYKCADCFCLPSIREGLNVSIMEAMANQLPVICSKIRGNIDLIDSYGGFLCNPFDSNDFRSAILDIVKRDKEMMGQYNLKKIENFSKEYVDLEMSKIYKNIFEDIE